MKYLRRIAAMVIGVVFFAALVISVGMIFAVKNINVTLISYADDCAASYIEAKQSLKVFKGESILFINSNDVAKVVENSNYTLSSCKKKYPCTINVVLKERLETFAVLTDGQYTFYDNDGKYLRKDLENKNITDGAPNVILSGSAVENINSVAKAASVFKETFKSLRSLVKSISLDVNPDVEGYTQKLYFNFYCGLKIQIDNYTEFTQEKILKSYEKFVTLTDREKLKGVIRGYKLGGEDGLVNADYYDLLSV